MNTEPRMALKVEFLSNENETLNGMFSIEERYEDVVRKAQWLINSNPLFLYRVLIPSSNFQWKWLIETNIGFFLVTGGKNLKRLIRVYFGAVWNLPKMLGVMV